MDNYESSLELGSGAGFFPGSFLEKLRARSGSGQSLIGSEALKGKTKYLKAVRKQP